MTGARCRSHPVRVALALLTVSLASLATVPAASAGVRVARYGPIDMGAFNVRYINTVVRPPQGTGHVVGLHARLVDARGRPVTIRSVMLHHVIFRRIWHRRAAPECTSRAGEAFYSTGEEDETLRFPPGYGYRVRRGDRWRVTAMLMSHATRISRVYLQYRVTTDTHSRLTSVHPFWLRAIGCGAVTSYPVPGGGAPGATDTRDFDWRVPYAGRIVAASGHLHGGAKDLSLQQPGCGDRRLLATSPRYGMPDDLMYRIRPVLHEPGPMDTRYFLSAAGIPVAAGETLRLSASYDGEHPHWAVMSTMHVYLARDRGAGRASCRPLPRDRHYLVKPGPARTDPPVVHIGLTALDAQGRTFALTNPPWPAQTVADGTTVDMRSEGVTPPHVAIPAGAQLIYRFPEATPHNLTYASGPRALGTFNLHGGQVAAVRFPVPGRYEFFCSLHPVTMHHVVDVFTP
jgi:plastocyanin